MAFGLKDIGEEFMQKRSYKPSSDNSGTDLNVGLYLDSTDALTDSADIGDITTEPSGTGYSRQAVTLDTADITITTDSNTNVVADFKDLSFDVSDDTSNVDGYFVVASTQSDVIKSDTSQNTHLLATGSLPSEQDLNGVNTLNVNDTGVVLD